MKINGEFEVKAAIVHSVDVNSHKYFRISYLKRNFFAQNEVESTSLLEDFEVEPLLNHWKAGELLGSFAIGHRLAMDAEIVRIDGEKKLSSDEIKAICLDKLH